MYWYYVADLYQIPLNITDATVSPPFDIYSSPLTLTGYELQTATVVAATGKTSQRYYTNVIASGSDLYVDDTNGYKTKYNAAPAAQ
jgi:hypothetical protein